MDRSLDSLSSQFRLKVDRVLARLVERGVAVMIVQTSRTIAEHLQNIADGTSATSHSKHVVRRLRGNGMSVGIDSDKADAIDLCPFLIYQLHGANKLEWDASDPAWKVIGEEYEREDLRWGGRWISPKDPGHGELIMSLVDRRLADEERKRGLV